MYMYMYIYYAIIIHHIIDIWYTISNLSCSLFHEKIEHEQIRTQRP